MHKIKKLLAVTTALFFGVTLLPQTQLVSEAASKPLISVTKKTINVGAKTTVKVAKGQKGYRVVCKTSNKTIAQIPSVKKMTKATYTTTIKGKKAGKATITVYVQRYTKKKWRTLSKKTFTLTVKAKATNPTDSGSGNDSSAFGLVNASKTALTPTTADGVTTYTISEGGSYTASGSASGVQIAITASSDVTLNLKNAQIDNSALSNKTAVITQEKDITTTIVAEGSNTLKGNTSGKAAKGVIYAEKGDLAFQGSGSLSLIDALADTPAAAKVLQTSDGIRTKKGSVSISSGTLSIDTYGDGIQAKKNIDISGGDVTIKTRFANNTTSYYTSGTTSVSNYNTLSEDEREKTKTEYINIDTGSHKGLKAGQKAEAIYVDGTYSADDSTAEASGSITISGGTIDIDTTAAGLKANAVSGSGHTRTSAEKYIIGSPDDAIKSNNNCTITGGKLHLKSGDDGLSAANTLSITGNASIAIDEAYEGIEAKTISVGSGSDRPEIQITSGDDGINASSKTVSYYYTTEDGEIVEDYNYRKVSVSDTNNSFTINSGSIRVQIPDSDQTMNGITYTPDGDGIDSNGDLFAYGGTLAVFTRANNTSNSALDADGTLLIQGAEVLAAGASGMDQISASGQGFVVLNTALTANDAFSVSDGSNTLFSTSMPQASAYTYYTSPSISVGSSYTVNGTSIEATSSAGGNGMMPGGGNPPGDNFPGGNPPDQNMPPKEMN